MGYERSDLEAEVIYTQSMYKLAEELGVNVHVAMDIDYLRMLERRIIAAAKIDPNLIDFEVFNERLENQLRPYDPDK
jgi:hypothetical protein